MFINKLFLSCLFMGSLFAVTSPPMLAMQPITNIFPPQHRFHTHGSNIRFFQSQGGDVKRLFVVWFQGDGERTGNNVQIFGSLKSLAGKSWAVPVQLTAKNIGYPDVNPALYVDTDSKGNNKFYLFWEKIYFHQWAGAVVHLNVATFTNDMRSLKELRWSDPTLTGKNISSEPGVLFPASYWVNVNTQLTNTWPLKQGKFNPSAFKQLPALAAADRQHLYNAAKLQFAMFGNDDDHLFKLNQKKRVAQLHSFSELLKKESKSEGGVESDLMSFLYWVYDTDTAIKMRDTLLNPNSKYYKIGWETRSNPLPVRLRDGTERLLLPLYSDTLHFSLVIYSDDQGASWHRANNPIMSRSGIQPALVQLSSGVIIAYLRNNAGILNLNRALVSSSSDNGLTWTPAVPSSNFRNNNSSLSVTKMTYGKYAGDIALVYNPDDRRNTLEVAISKDDGVTWHKKIVERVNEGGAERFEYPSITRASDGDLYISFTHDLDPAFCSGHKDCQTIGVIRISPVTLLHKILCTGHFSKHLIQASPSS